jgi:hypothetical protein
LSINWSCHIYNNLAELDATFDVVRALAKG